MCVYRYASSHTICIEENRRQNFFSTLQYSCVEVDVTVFSKVFSNEVEESRELSLQDDMIRKVSRIQRNDPGNPLMNMRLVVLISGFS